MNEEQYKELKTEIENLIKKNQEQSDYIEELETEIDILQVLLDMSITQEKFKQSIKKC